MRMQTYLLGKPPENKAAEFGLARFNAFKQSHLDLEEQIQDPHFSIVCRFLEQWNPAQIEDHPILKEVGTGFGIFQIQGEKKPVHESPAIQQWWTASLEKEETTSPQQCLLSGESKKIAQLHLKIKGVTGAQSAGASIVSFNGAAYESYGKIQNFNAPISEDAAFRYVTALNSLLTGPQRHKHRLQIGDTTTAFWTEAPTNIENCLIHLFSSGSHALEEEQDTSKLNQLKRLLLAIKTGQNFEQLEDTETHFHILGLAPNAARISIRFYHQSTIEELLHKLHSHQSCFQIIQQFTKPSGKRHADPEFPAVWQMIRETARVPGEIPPLLEGALTRSIIQGTPYPETLFTSIIRRIHADRTINYLRAGILKAILTRNHNQTIPIMLDTNNNEPAYLLGRLFSTLEKTQEDALGKINSGIRDKFYSSASSTPASVFPRILRTYQHHLSKLNDGARIHRENLIQDIVSSIDSSGFPAQLDLQKQGVFAIGYYHQRKDFFTKKDTQTSSNH